MKLKIPDPETQEEERRNWTLKKKFIEIVEQGTIKRHISAYYDDLFKHRKLKDSNEEIEKYLTNHGTYKISIYTVLPNNIQNLVTIHELKKSLDIKRDSSSPGPCNFTAGWVKKFWRDINECFFDAVQIYHQRKILPNLQTTGDITLIPKGDKDRMELGNWQPITLLSIFYKIISGIYAMLLKKSLPYIIGLQQKTYLPGRNITKHYKKHLGHNVHT